MAKIHLLDNDTINKIAAGEVIENPKSIVKELIENSIDAEADEIIVEIKKGGKGLIRISDNGKGIDKNEIEEAFKRHCTSKIKSSDDLNYLFTLGFRGEALASIAAVSHVNVISRTNNDTYGIKLEIKGGEVIVKEDIGCPVGTTITVTELFYNVPARKKFLKSDASESSHINEIVTSLALSKENISFKYINNSNVAFKTPKTNNFINTISSLYDKELYNSLLNVNYKNDIIEITGYTTNLNYYRGNRKHQLIFVNGRYIKHKRINYFIEAAYNTLLPKNKYPACFLKLEVEPALIDVNVHPAKTELRFQNEELILNEVKKSIYKALNSANIIKEIKKETFHEKSKKTNVNNSIFDNKSVENTLHINYDDLNNIDNIKFTEVNYKVDNDIKNKNIFEEAIEDSIKKDENYKTLEDNCISEGEGDTQIYLSTKDKDNKKQQILIEENIIEKIPELSIIGVIMDTYIICENKTKKEMYMIDQHAAHERINYEKFLYQFQNSEILKQELIVPEVINLSYEDFSIAADNENIFENLGISFEKFGINAILISNIPVIFSNTNIKELFYTILDSIKGISKSNIQIDKIIKNACVQSVKSGDKLHTLEIKKLIENLRNTDNPYTCPHGRPVIIKMSKYEIERMFERIQS
ncbi:DNA mismatch repair endonuclease MutL [Sedimentibacter sp. MB31-C6]|uniref:DNA mismatch repair endonuclease MutL n=1 Tax=Sedimentibacter sp. MB31-C6 TaxID=3109366 RepID=UPI002DDCC3C3|nr:DNA mismatch repair endonuclease MutL [Sedimentibacter sp. MB36-C1]WSI04228.1 DNA mismatch repair endonuclease MutL [Sedimentibacter sp. MB36-C1]